MKVFDWCWENRRLNRGCNSSFLKLVLKVSNPIVFSEFRPMSLIVTLYKIIAKTLAKWLKSVIGEVIRDSQTTFIEGRSIADNVLVVDAPVSLKKSGHKALLFKDDFEKASDCVNW